MARRGRSHSWLTLALAAGLFAACGAAIPDRTEPAPIPSPVPTFQPGVEHMPGPASIWLTSSPASPRIAVAIEMTSPADPGIHYAHTFPPGGALRGSIATSQGAYRLSALGGACTLDLQLGPSAAVEVELALEGATCALTVGRSGSLDDPAMWHDEPAVLITNGGLGLETPATP